MSRSTVAANAHRSGYAGRDGPLQDSRDAGRWDELDAILNGGDSPKSPASQNGATAEGNQIDPARREAERRAQAGDAEGEDGLGIDREIKVRKARVPAVKLDEERLLSQKGIPKLRRINKERLKFKGKGHEFSDVARLLNVYQLWLDDLFPKANFADGLGMIEKLGHKKRLQIMRREWIDEDKPCNQVDGDEAAARDEARHEAVVEQDAATREADERAQQALSASQQGQSRAQDAEMEDPAEDELDALLAQETDEPARPVPPTSKPVQTDDYRSEDDDMDALDAMGDDW